MNWPVPQMWQGGECWIIGGGSSLARQFEIPQDVIDSVESNEAPPSTYSDYLQPLHNKHVIGTNVGFTLGDWISIGIFCDRQFLFRHREAIRGFKGIMVTDLNDMGDIPETYTKNIKRLKRDNRNGISTQPDKICWNFNTGAGAINLALLLGAEKIYLLGYDMNRGGELNRSHWHQGQPCYENVTSPKNFDRFLSKYPQMDKEIKQKYPNVQIFNVNPESGLDVWPKLNLKDVL